MMKKRLFFLLTLLLTTVTQGAWATGELTGRFSVAETKQVVFSQGNLQAMITYGPTNNYNYTSSSWKFAEHQWDFIGNDGGNITFDILTKIDLFGWVGASAEYNTYGLCTYSNPRNNYYGTSNSEALKNDWGKNIGNGWHTLSIVEWDYLFNTRTASTVGGTPNGRYAKATVNNVIGIILFPDNYTHPDGVTTPTGVNAGDAAFNSNNYNDTDWSKMETVGTVFLPAAGCRNSGMFQEYWADRYWSSTSDSSFDVADYAYNVLFYSGDVITQNYNPRSMGCSVRLVKLAPLPTDNDGAYLIGSAADWETFCNNVNNGSFSYSGETVKLTTNINSSTIVGTEAHPFAGTFDGDGHTLNVDIASNDIAAPFGIVGNVTIKNLHVTGSVTTTMTKEADHTGGLIGRAGGTVTLENVRVSATVTGLTYYSGFIGNGNRNDVSRPTTIKMTGCVFDGQLTENIAGETQHAGGFIGWGGNMSITMTDCLFAGTCTIAASGSGARNFHPVGYTGNSGISVTLSNVYYSVDPSAQNQVNNGTAISNNAKRMRSIDYNDENVLSLGFSGKATEYNVSNIISYADNKGLKYANFFYAGNGESVNLTLSHAAAAAGQHFTGYAVSGGGSLTAQTEATATLTMSDADQTISAEYADNPSYYVTLAEGTVTGWSTTPNGTAREGELVTVSYQGEHKMKSVTVNPQSGDAIQVYMSKTGDTYSGTFTMPASDVEISTKLYYKLSAEKSWADNWRLYCLQSDFFLDRTLTKDVWNTFASPFAIPADKMEAYFGAGAKVLKLSSSTIEEGNVLSLNFEKVTEIAAGYPYIVKPTVNVVEPTFADADYYNSYANLVRTTYVNFFATLGLYEMYFYPKEVLVMTIEGKLVHPNPAWDIKGYRGFFTLPQIYNQARAFRINFGDGETTDIDATLVNSEKVNSDVYDLQGRKVTQPKQKGIYIQNGRKAIIK